MKKMPGGIINLHLCTTNEWYMIPEIWSLTEIIFCHFGPFFALLPPKQSKKSNFWKYEKTLRDIILCRCAITDNHMVYDSCDMKKGRQNSLSFVSFLCFLPFYPTNNPKNQNFKNTKKTPEDTIILHKCIKNHDHMLYFWDNVCDRCNCYFWFWATYQTAQKIKIKKKWKKHLEISFYKSALNHYHMLYCS